MVKSFIYIADRTHPNRIAMVIDSLDSRVDICRKHRHIFPREMQRERDRSKAKRIHEKYHGAIFFTAFTSIIQFGRYPFAVD